MDKEFVESLKDVFVTHELLDTKMSEKFEKLSLENQNNMHKLHKDICKDVENSNNLQRLQTKDDINNVKIDINESIKRIEDIVKEDKIAVRDKKLDNVNKIVIGVGTAIIIFVITSIIGVLTSK